MSFPNSNSSHGSSYNPARVCLNPFAPLFSFCLQTFPFLSRFAAKRRAILIYTSGVLFSLAFWVFFDAISLSARAKSPYGDPDTPPEDRGDPPVRMTFVDWVPGIFSLIGYLIVVLIDKDRVRGDGEGLYGGGGDDRAVWRARLFLFVGFAGMAGGVAGSVTVLLLKYIIPHHPPQFVYYGYANVSLNVLVMLSAIVLWMAQSSSGEYEYNLTL